MHLPGFSAGSYISKIIWNQSGLGKVIIIKIFLFEFIFVPFYADKQKNKHYITNLYVPCLMLIKSFHKITGCLLVLVSKLMILQPLKRNGSQLQ